MRKRVADQEASTSAGPVCRRRVAWDLVGRLLGAVGAWIGLIAILVAGVVLADFGRPAWHDASMRAEQREILAAEAAANDVEVADAEVAALGIG